MSCRCVPKIGHRTWVGSVSLCPRNSQVSADGQLGLWQRSLRVVETICRSSLRADEDTLTAVMSCGHGDERWTMESQDFWQISMQQLFSWWHSADLGFPASFSSLLRACVECNQWCVAANLFETSMDSEQSLYPSSCNAAITMADPAMFGWHVAFHVLERMTNGRFPGCWSTCFFG